MGLGAISAVPKQFVNTGQHRAMAWRFTVLLTTFALTKYFQ